MDNNEKWRKLTTLQSTRLHKVNFTIDAPISSLATASSLREGRNPDTSSPWLSVYKLTKVDEFITPASNTGDTDIFFLSSYHISAQLFTNNTHFFPWNESSAFITAWKWRINNTMFMYKNGLGHQSRLELSNHIKDLLAEGHQFRGSMQTRWQWWRNESLRGCIDSWHRANAL